MNAEWLAGLQKHTDERIFFSKVVSIALLCHKPPGYQECITELESAANSRDVPRMHFAVVAAFAKLSMLVGQMKYSMPPMLERRRHLEIEWHWSFCGDRLCCLRRSERMRPLRIRLNGRWNEDGKEVLIPSQFPPPNYIVAVREMDPSWAFIKDEGEPFPEMVKFKTLEFALHGVARDGFYEYRLREVHDAC